MEYRFATDDDLELLAEWNHQLIRDEGHRNRMTVLELLERMKGWLEWEYRGVIFVVAGEPVLWDGALTGRTPGRVLRRRVDDNL